MPRSQAALRGEVVVLHPPKAGQALVASGRQVNLTKKDPTRRFRWSSSETWQALAWTFYDTIGEFRYSVNWVGNILSKATLVAIDTRTGEKVTDPVVQGVMDDLYGGADYQGEMLRELGIQFTVPGDCYLIGVPGKTAADDKWQIASSTALTRQGDDWLVNGKVCGQIPKTLMIRLWRPHPANNEISDSPTRAVLPILSEIDGLTKHTAAQIDSRLASAGIMLVPEEIDFSTKQTLDGGVDEDGNPLVVLNDIDSADALANELIEVASEAIASRESAAALVPIILQAKGDVLAKIQFIKFWTELDEHAQAMRDEAIRRLALGMDMPPEILTGSADVNHWTSWQIEEASIKAHTEPLLAIITSSLTEAYLTPNLIELGVADAEFIAIVADTSKMRLRPNRSKEALELYDRGELSGVALRRENGFDESDAMLEEERKAWFMFKLATTGSPTPAMMVYALQSLGINMPISAAATESTTDDEGDDEQKEAQPAPSLEGHPDNSPPDIGDAVSASAVMVMRALERAGNRLKNRRAATRATEGVKAWNVHQYSDYDNEDIPALLDGAWDCVTEFTFKHDIPPQKLAVWLNKYTVMLLEDRRGYDKGTLEGYLLGEMLLSGVV